MSSWSHVATSVWVSIGSRSWLGVWWHQAMNQCWHHQRYSFCGIHLRAVSVKVHMNSCSDITLLKSLPYLPGVNELLLTGPWLRTLPVRLFRIPRAHLSKRWKADKVSTTRSMFISTSINGSSLLVTVHCACAMALRDVGFKVWGKASYRQLHGFYEQILKEMLKKRIRFHHLSISENWNNSSYFFYLSSPPCTT